MSLSSRPLPEDDSIEADILDVTGPDSQPGKNWRFSVKFVLLLDTFLCREENKTH